MKKANEEQASKFAGVFVEHHNLLTNAPSLDLQWAIQNPQDAVLLFVDALVARGKQAITAVKKTLTPWKTIKIDGKPIDQVIMAIKKENNEISNLSRDIMGKPAFKVAREEESVDLVVLTPKDLGFTANPRTDEFMTKEFCAKWSTEHLDGYVVELCHPEVGQQLRLQYQDQPEGEVLWIAMERIADSDGYPYVFYLVRNDDGLWLRNYWALPDTEWFPGSRFVFRLRKVS